MAVKFWFGKKHISDDSKDSGSDGSGASGGSVVMTEAVFPTGFGEQEQDIPGRASEVDLDKVKREVEFVKRNVAKHKIVSKIDASNRKPVVTTEIDEKSALKSKQKEGSVNIVDNRGGPTFKTVSIPGVVDGGKPNHKPVMTPVRMAATTAPIRLKSRSETQKDVLEKAQSALQSKPTTSALKVINKGHVSEQIKTDSPKFGLHVRKKTEPVNLVSAPNASTAAVSSDLTATVAPANYVKPKNDQRVLYYQLMNGLYDAILVLDDHGHVVDCNDRVQKVLGYSREEAWDLPVEKVIKGMNSQMFAHLKKNLAENHNVLITARCFKSSGDSFKGEIGVSTLSLTRAHNVVFAIRNVDQRKSTMADLRKAAAAFDISLASSFACNPEGFFTNVNKTLMDSFGITDAKQALKVRFIDMLPDATRSFAKALNGEYIREHLVVADAYGQNVTIDIALAPMKNGTEVIGVAGSMLPM